MKVLYLIGNGFDLNLGMNTRYSDFLKYYKDIPSQSEIINKLKSNISDKLKDWSDLELALGAYTENLNTIEDLDEILIDLSDNLAEYLSQEENKIDLSKPNKTKLYADLSFPENNLPQRDLISIQEYKEIWATKNWQVNIVTFNYTNSLEKLLVGLNSSQVINLHHNTGRIIVYDLDHIHGYTDNRMIIGVNDISQIGNTSFHDVTDVTESFVKSQYNQAAKHSIDVKTAKHINDANLIVIFGSSLGETDKIWWEMIGERLKSNCKLIIFTNSQEHYPRQAFRQVRKANALQRLFLMRTNLSEEDKEAIMDKIYVGINSGMFKNII